MSFTVQVSLCRALVTAVYMFFVYLSYIAYHRDELPIESIVQSFALNTAISHFARNQILASDKTLARPVFFASCAIIAVCCVFCCLSFNFFVSEVMFGVVCAVGIGGISAVEYQIYSLNEYKLKQTISLFTMCFTCFTCMCFYAGIRFLRHYETLHRSGILLAIVIIIAATAKFMPLIDASIAFCKELHQHGSSARQRYERIYSICFPMVFAVIGYYDILYPFIVIYTNHIELPSSQLIKIQPPTDWIKLDHIEVTLGLLSIFALSRTLSSFIFSLLLSDARLSKVQVNVVLASLCVKLVCVALLPIGEISIYTVIVASLCTGAIDYRFTLPSYSQKLDREIFNVVAVLLLLFIFFGKHVDDEMTTIIVSAVLSGLGIFFMIFISLLISMDGNLDLSLFQMVSKRFNIPCMNPDIKVGLMTDNDV